MVFYVEDSWVVVLVICCMMEKIGFIVCYVVSVEDVLVLLEVDCEFGWVGVDVVFIDVSLKGEFIGGDLFECICIEFGYSKGWLLVLVMIGDENLVN